MRRSLMLGISVIGATATVALASCRSGNARIVPPGLTGVPAKELNLSELAVTVICTDSLGRDGSTIRESRCLPCLPLGVEARPDGALQHARRMWTHVGRAPHDTLHRGSSCALLAYDLARTARPDDPALDVELAVVRLASRNDSVRALGLARADRVIDSLVSRDEPGRAAELVEQLARGMWDRAQRMLERPSELGLDAWEKDAHDLTQGAPRLARLPSIPRTSSRIGVSEAEWAARLFDRAASLVSSPAQRSALHRLALAPWVVMGRWSALDSAAAALLVRAPLDSAVLPARALAAYHLVRRPVFEHPAVMALFDSALVRMPRADSLRHDTFDNMMSQSDDEWRYGFLPSDRERLDRRGWVVLDPLWSTPVNEVRLARRARVAEADYRHADVAKPAQAGSETRAGAMLLRQGPMTPTWRTRTMGPRLSMQRRWGDFMVESRIEISQDVWRAFYTSRLSAQEAASWPATNQTCSRSDVTNTMLSCATARRADWTGVPFWGMTDTIDVSVARFRGPADSMDVYVGARVPLRRFRHRDETGAAKSDRIVLGAFFATPLGRMVYHGEERRALPAENLVAWTAQWTPRMGHGEVMHRVEAMEPSEPAGARGAVIHTSDAQVTIPLRGFGMSDVLVAASAREIRTPVMRWSDLALQPNGAVVAPRAPFELAWEVYDLTPAPDGRIRWRVSIHREKGTTLRRDDPRAIIAGANTAGDRILADEADVPAVSYTRDASAAAAVAEHVRFNMGDTRSGRHVIEVRIEDLVSGRKISRSVSVRVLDPQAQRRNAPAVRGTSMRVLAAPPDSL